MFICRIELDPEGFGVKVRRDIVVVTCVMSQQKPGGLTEGDGEWTHTGSVQNHLGSRHYVH